MYLDSVFEQRQTASESLAKRLASVLTQAIEARGTASLVVSGGSSPKAMFHALRRYPLEWDKVTIVPSDERVVAADHADRNANMIRRELMQECAASAVLLDLIHDHTDPEAAVVQASRALEKIDYPFDAVVLGMGDDGHTASLFPDAPDIAEVLVSQSFCVLQTIARLPSARVSLTAHILLNAREIDLLLFGENKWEVLNKAKREGSLAEFPVRTVLHQHTVPVTTYWAP